MSIEITVGPAALTINCGSTFMVTDLGGEIDADAAEGVFDDDTRFVSTYHLRINGAPWVLQNSAPIAHNTARLHLTNPYITAFEGTASEIEPSTLALRVVRSVGEGAVEESFQLCSYAPAVVDLVLELELASDFDDLFEVKWAKFRQRPNLVTQWEPQRAALVTSYQNGDFIRRFTYQIVHADRPPSYANGRLFFPIQLERGGLWRAEARMLLEHDVGQLVRSPSPPNMPRAHATELHGQWLGRCTNLLTANENLHQIYRQAVHDLGALRLYEHDLGPDLWVPAGGVPWYVALFGRDSLITALQSVSVNARCTEGALRTLALYQARERDDWRDAQPGKILHEIRRGELAHFDVVPQTPYYGTWDATPLFLMVLGEAWHWLGDPKLIEEMRPTMERCLDWIDHYGDLDGDGFQEYRTFSPKGYENMGWKDSPGAVVYPDGRPVRQPKALCELQGYVHAAKESAAELFQVLGEVSRAETLRAEAAQLKQRFNAVFWMPDEGTYAYGLDAEKQQIKTIASNVGHCLWTGIVDADKAEQVVKRLLAPDMWTGWGIRTLSSENPAYNPFSYHNGSVWPHDNAIIAAGMKRYGFHAEANQVARGVLDAAACFDHNSLPEVFAGIERDPGSFPVQYLGANIPQSWAAGAVFQLIQTALGLRADAPHQKLFVKPTLPDWISSLELRGLKVGRAALDLRFWREGDHSCVAVESREGGDIHVIEETQG